MKNNLESEYITSELNYWQNRYLTAEQRATSIGVFAGILFSMLAALIINHNSTELHDLPTGNGLNITITLLLVSVLCSTVSLIPFNFGIKSSKIFFIDRAKKLNDYGESLKHIQDGTFSTVDKNWLLYQVKNKKEITKEEIDNSKLKELLVLKKAIVFRQIMTVIALLSLMMAFIIFSIILFIENNKII